MTQPTELTHTKNERCSWLWNPYTSFIYGGIIGTTLALGIAYLDGSGPGTITTHHQNFNKSPSPVIAKVRKHVMDDLVRELDPNREENISTSQIKYFLVNTAENSTLSKGDLGCRYGYAATVMDDRILLRQTERPEECPQYIIPAAYAANLDEWRK